MKLNLFTAILLFCFLVTANAQQNAAPNGAVLMLASRNLATQSLKLDGFFYETAQGRTFLPEQLTRTANRITAAGWRGGVSMPDGRNITMTVAPKGPHFVVTLQAQPDSDITKWGFAIDARPDEYYTGLMERVVDGPQAASWAPGRSEAMNLRGQKVEMIVKPTTSIYAPYYISSRGYAVFVEGTWPGLF